MDLGSYQSVRQALDYLIKQFQGFWAFMTKPIVNNSVGIALPSNLVGYTTPLALICTSFITLITISLIFRIIRLFNILA